jgi:hypothetical protein
MVEYVASFVEVFRAFQVNVPMKTIVDVPH